MEYNYLNFTKTHIHQNEYAIMKQEEKRRKEEETNKKKKKEG